MEDKKMKKSSIILLMTIVLVVLNSCKDFLDQYPDQRVEWKTVEQIKNLMVTAYSEANYCGICELSSDNLIDNQSPDTDGSNVNLPPYERWHDESFAWKQVSESGSCTPSDVWEGYYHAIAVCNHALKEMEKMDSKELNGYKGEALVSRAYHHFILVNIFSHTYKNQNQTDLGIPYITEPENVVEVFNERETVPKTYAKIEKDLLDGMKLIDNNAYDVPSFHFNRKATYAFAARFYLFKRDWDKVIYYSNLVLGGDPADTVKTHDPRFRNWAGTFPNYLTIIYWYVDHTTPNNLLLMASYSTGSRIYNFRYGCARKAEDATLKCNGPSSVLARPFVGKLFLRNTDLAGSFFMGTAGELFEYTDKIAGIGHAHQVRSEFTMEETLLCRAEAKVHLGLIDEAIKDFNIYETARVDLSKDKAVNLTRKGIIDYFSQPAIKPHVYQDLNPKSISSDWNISDEMIPFINCVLLYRRVETIHMGNRWFDIKRYGIEITHVIGKEAFHDVLKVDDERRAIQIPSEVEHAGLNPNPPNKPDPVKSIENTIKFAK